jgi:F-type H+-transporting ATPase subunit b
LKPTLKFRIAPLLLALPLMFLLSVPAKALAQENAQPAAANAPSPQHMDEPETPAQMEAFRHSDAVKSVARHLHLSVETTATIIQDLNSGILIALILWFLLRYVPKAFRKRNENLQKKLVEARLAAAEANERLAKVEERLSKLGIEIEAIREQTERDMTNDEKRIQEALEAERQRMVASAEQEIDAAGAAAQRELKKFAAQLAVNRARQEIHLSLEEDRALIRTFGENLKGERN